MSQVTPKYSVGDIVFYHMLPADQPTEPEKEWSGVVTAIHSSLFYVIVTILTEGFEGLEEHVRFTQIIRAEKQDASTQENKA